MRANEIAELLREYADRESGYIYGDEVEILREAAALLRQLEEIRAILKDASGYAGADDVVRLRHGSWPKLILALSDSNWCSRQKGCICTDPSLAAKVGHERRCPLAVVSPSERCPECQWQIGDCICVRKARPL